MSACCAKNLQQLDKELLKKPVIVSIGPETSRYLTVMVALNKLVITRRMLNLINQ